MKKPIAARAMEILREYCMNTHNGNVRAAAEALGMDPDAGVLHRWLRGGGTPSLAKIGECLDRIGVELLAPWEVPGKKDADEKTVKLLNSLQTEIEKAHTEISLLQGEVRALDRVITSYQVRGMETQIELERLKKEMAKNLERIGTLGKGGLS